MVTMIKQRGASYPLRPYAPWRQGVAFVGSLIGMYVYIVIRGCTELLAGAWAGMHVYPLAKAAGCIPQRLGGS
jgi:hypothetical protein